MKKHKLKVMSGDDARRVLLGETHVPEHLKVRRFLFGLRHFWDFRGDPTRYIGWDDEEIREKVREQYPRLIGVIEEWKKGEKVQSEMAKLIDGLPDGLSADEHDGGPWSVEGFGELLQ